MRSASRLFFSGLIFAAGIWAGPAAAQGSGYDQLQLLRSVREGLAPEPQRTPTQWLDVGVAFPIGDFDDREWDPGLSVRWTQQVWGWEVFSIHGSLGVLWNDDTRFNESQVDVAFDNGPGTFTPIDSRSHLMVPFSMEFQLEPAVGENLSPFISGGPAMAVTRESLVRQDWFTVVFSGDANHFVVPDIDANPPPALLADRAVNKTRIHPGFALHGGLRAKVGSGRQPLHMRLVAGWNTWYERDRPVSQVTGSISFGR